MWKEDRDKDSEEPLAPKARSECSTALATDSNRHIARPHAGADNVHIPVWRDASMFWYGSDNRLWVVLTWVSPVYSPHERAAQRDPWQLPLKAQLWERAVRPT